MLYHITRSFRICPVRSYTTGSSNTIPLSFTKYPARGSIQNSSPLAICHGLFGSKQNWRGLAKAMSQRLSRDVYAMDLRNHGESPHSLPHTYQVMADDLKQWVLDQGLKNITFLGHSMGGKTVMTLALTCPEIVSKLIVADIAPVHMPLLSEFPRYVEGFKMIESRQPTRQTDAEQLMMQYEPDPAIRQFLLTNVKKSRQDGVYRLRVPIDILGNALGNLGEFIQGHQYHGPTLFITGGISPYRKLFLAHPDLVDQQFPHSTMEVMPNCGHWLHAENPELFLSLICNFINNVESHTSIE
ncbi:Alpha/Beta hydrolase protein [Halteromyces radiatus]|uniref:Alpha/Beta hydrolase protein n=1 Tax=Halteromyces radiatus TaxID=101107 RepID=UPI00221E6B6A|nr:Alpha/Beta hydrolase protein [Halteromyces radiatus]KAI8088740.1 Alpha/Beta hydrolase protein [Halteromyces radiatus]